MFEDVTFEQVRRWEAWERFLPFAEQVKKLSKALASCGPFVETLAYSSFFVRMDIH